MKNWYVEEYYSSDSQRYLYKVFDYDTSTAITTCVDKKTAELIADAPKMLEALKYYKYECSGNEPSISVFEQMVNEILGELK